MMTCKLFIDDDCFEFSGDSLLYLHSCLPYWNEMPQDLWPVLQHLEYLVIEEIRKLEDS